MTSCPHGLRSSPSTCSQCLGYPARLVVRNDLTGEILVGGVVEPNRGLMRVNGAVALNGRGNVATCRKCGVPGHKAIDCHRRPRAPCF